MSTTSPGASARRMRGAVADAAAGPARHPLERSDRLAAQAAEAVGLLERFGDLVSVALDAVGRGDDDALRGALAEREGVLTRLQPVLAELAAARDAIGGAGPNARDALAAILRPVDQALRYAQLLHIRLTDEVPPPVEALRPARPALAIVR